MWRKWKDKRKWRIFIWKVKHGKDATKEIVVTPNDGYRVLSISVNGENINFSEEEDNSVKIPLFKNVTQNKNVYATFIEESKWEK